MQTNYYGGIEKCNLKTNDCIGTLKISIVIIMIKYVQIDQILTLNDT